MTTRSFTTAFWSMCVGFALLVIADEPSQAQTGTITGTVVAAQGEAPLAGASVSVIGTVRGAITNANGVYELTIPPGVYTLRARMIGFQSMERRITVRAGQLLTVDFQLPPGALLMDEIAITGARTPRTVDETPVPVDVITSADVRSSGQFETGQLLSFEVPSFHASHQTISDGTDHVNPASLRGLGPDQVLVLVNGKRRHQSGLVHVNGTFGRGTVGVDLNAIPTSAIERIEVLRDGAAAQYGSDAISGVINIVLKQQTDALEVNTMAGLTGEGDGETVKTDVNYGFGIGERGYFNISGEFLNRERTNRSDTYTGGIFASDGAGDEAELAARGLTRDDFSMKTGQSEAIVGAAFFNSVYPLDEASELYAFGGISHRNGVATGFYRLPHQEERVVFEIFPNGFLPQIHTEIDDQSVGAGIRGNRSGWDLDFSVSHGGNSFQFNIENTVNASLGASSPTTFDAGRLSFRQTTGNFDAVRIIDTQGALRSLSLVLGAEFRIENYQIEAGEDASWQLGNGGTVPGEDFDTTSTGAPKNPGSQVFPGFQPSNEVNRFRNSISTYAGLEIQATEEFLIDVGGRFENYNDFGSRLIGKIAARYEVAPNVALRGAVSTGFRAPSLHQVWFNNVSIQFLLDPVTGELEPSRVLTANNRSAVATAFGLPPLDEEKSVNISAGLTARPVPNFSLTADLYRITIDDRIVLTSRFSDSDPTVAMLLEPFEASGVGAAQFFANAVDTETFGVDLVATYVERVGDGQLTLTGAANFTNTNVERTNVPSSLLRGFEETIFDREERNRLEDALPRQKASIGAQYTVDRISFGAQANYFGSVEYKPTDPANDETFDPKVLLDLNFGIDVMTGARLVLGANNVFNTFPDRHQISGNLSAGRFPYSRRVTQFGTNGGFYYARLQLTL